MSDKPIVGTKYVGEESLNRLVRNIRRADYRQDVKTEQKVDLEDELGRLDVLTLWNSIYSDNQEG